MARADSRRKPKQKSEGTLRLCSKCTGAPQKRNGVQPYAQSPQHLPFKIRSGQLGQPPPRPQKQIVLRGPSPARKTVILAAMPTGTQNVCGDTVDKYLPQPWA